MTYTYNKIEQLVQYSENAVNETKKERVSRIISMSVIPRGGLCRRLNTYKKNKNPPENTIRINRLNYKNDHEGIKVL